MTLRTLNYGNYGIFLIMGNAGFCPSTVPLLQGSLSFARAMVQGLYPGKSVALSLCLQRPGGGVTSLHVFLYICFSVSACTSLSLSLSLSLCLSLSLSLSLSNWLLYYTTVLKRPFRVCKCPAKMDPPECNCEGLMAVSQNELLHVLWGVCYTTSVITTLLQMLSGSLHAKPQDTGRSAGRSSHSPYKLQV